MGDWFPLHFLHSLTVNYADFTEIWLSLYCNYIYNLWTYVIVVQWLFACGKALDWKKMWNPERIIEVIKDYKVQTCWALLPTSSQLPFFPLNMQKLIWRKSERLLFYFLAKFLLVAFVFALIGNLELFLSPESLSIISGASLFPVYLNESWKSAFQKLF